MSSVSHSGTGYRTIMMGFAYNWISAPLLLGAVLTLLMTWRMKSTLERVPGLRTLREPLEQPIRNLGGTESNVTNMMRVTIYFTYHAYYLGIQAMRKNFPLRGMDTLLPADVSTRSITALLGEPLSTKQMQFIELGRTADFIETYVCTEWLG